MTDRELRARIHRALDSQLPALREDPALSERILRTHPRPRKRGKRALVGPLVALLTLAALGAALAEAAGLHLFDGGLARLQPQLYHLATEAALDTAPLHLTVPGLGDVEAGITDAYCDGGAAVFTWYIRGGISAEPLSLDSAEAMMAAGQLSPDSAQDVWGTPQEFVWDACVEAGTPTAVHITRLAPALPDDAHDSWSGGATQTGCDEQGSSQTGVMVSRALNPMAEGQLTLRVPLLLTVSDLYFDGQRVYRRVAGEPEEVGSLQVTVPVVPRETRRLMGACADLRAEAIFSRLTVELHLTRPAAPPPSQSNCAVLLCLTDGTGAGAWSEAWLPEGDGDICLTLNGLGNLPDRAEVYLFPVKWPLGASGPAEDMASDRDAPRVWDYSELTTVLFRDGFAQFTPCLSLGPAEDAP